MGIRTVKPTSPARRYLTYVTNEEITKNDAGEEPALAQAAHQWPQRATAGSRCGTGAAGPSACSGRSTSAARSSGSPPGWPRSSTIRTGRRGWRCSTIATARSGTSSPRSASRSGDTLMSGPQADILPGNALPIRNIPLGTLVHNVELQPGKRRPDLPQRGHPGPAPGQGRRPRHPQAALRRGAAGPAGVHGHHRPGRQPRSRERVRRQGGARALEGLPARPCAAP